MAKKRKGRGQKASPGQAKPKGVAKAEATSDAVPEPATDIPKTRQHTQPAAGPAERPSALQLGATRTRAVAIGGVQFSFSDLPDDGPLSRRVRMVDEILGKVEQAILVVLLAAVVLAAATAGVFDKLLHSPLGRWWFTVVRGGTFSIAMFGAVFATHQQRHLAMDLISRSLSARGRLILGMVLKLFVIGVVYLLWKSGLHQREAVGESSESFISDQTIVTAIPIGAALIMLHSVLHLIIDADYLRRGKLPAERMRSGH